MAFLRNSKSHKELSEEIKSVSDKTDRTALELSIVKKRQEEISRRLEFLNQELSVQQRKL